MQREDVETVEQIAAEAAALHLLLEIAVRRRKDSRVHRDRLGAADGNHLALLEHAQELHLRGRRRLADLVEEERALGRGLEQPRLSFIAPVNDPFTWPNSSLSSRLSGSAPQLIEMNGPSARCDRSWM